MFLQELNHDYKTKVKTQNPKMLEDAIKSAQIYDDNIDSKPSHGFAKSTSQPTHGVTDANAKHKIGATSREVVPKKPKGTSSPL